MKQSQLFTKTQKHAPKDEVSLNAQLLIRAGFIDKEMAGVYSFLPLGLRTLNKIISIIRQEMNALGGQEVFLTALQNPKVWKKTDRWSDKKVDVWFKTKIKTGGDVGLSVTHEEPLTNLVTKHIHSYKDLPQYIYQFQNKFRNEKRAKSGIMRSREFIMKDLYSFSRTQEEHEKFYEEAKRSYLKIFERLGIGKKTYLTFASGGSFSRYSHEFQTICEAGEDIIYVDEKKNIAINKEVYNDKVLADLKLDKNNLKEVKAAEVGNIFSLGTKFSEAFNLIYQDEKGDNQKVIMGSYGIGPARVMGVITELFSDEKGLVWPEAVAPFKIHLLSLDEDKKAEELYQKFLKNNLSVLYDDRNIQAGNKFADADLIGLPYRLVISQKSLAKGGVEVKQRTEKESQIVSLEKIISELK
jgi:prolyl-tRNA synthetase